nr:hypothetical protein [uncultured Nitrososphaera sp.]
MKMTNEVYRFVKHNSAEFGVSLDYVASALKLQPNIAARLLNSLVDSGMLAKEGDDKYRVAEKLQVRCPRDGCDGIAIRRGFKRGQQQYSCTKCGSYFFRFKKQNLKGDVTVNVILKCSNCGSSNTTVKNIHTLVCNDCKEERRV